MVIPTDKEIREAATHCIEAVRRFYDFRHADVDNQCASYIERHIIKPLLSSLPKPESGDDVDAYRTWERTHNRENYGRCDAYSAGIQHARAQHNTRKNPGCDATCKNYCHHDDPEVMEKIAQAAAEIMEYRATLRRYAERPFIDGPAKSILAKYPKEK